MNADVLRRARRQARLRRQQLLAERRAARRLDLLPPVGGVERPAGGTGAR